MPRLAPRAVEREHELPSQALTERVTFHEPLELPDQIVMAPDLELRSDPLLQRRRVDLVEACDLGLSKRLVGEIGEGRAAPERERLSQSVGRSDRIAGHERAPSLSDQRFETVEVELTRLHA